jgi:hypothetical protein
MTTLLSRLLAAARQLWAKQPARVTGWVVAGLALIGVVVTPLDVQPVLVVLIPELIGVEVVRRRVYSPFTVETAEKETGDPHPEH